MTYESPWPSPINLWGNPPWLMSGKCLTAWFESDIERVRSILSPSFTPKVGKNGVITRLRFYDINYSPVAKEEAQIPGNSGSFKEAVVAFAGEIDGVQGEYSAFMWTDSLVYFSWGRENFGWPLLISEIELSGGFWDASSEDQSRGKITTAGASWELTCENHVQETISVGSATAWLTPRRTLFSRTETFEKRELLIVRPEIIEPGLLTTHKGQVNFSAAPDSILAGLQPLGDCTIHQHSKFLLSVGEDVETKTEQ